MKTNIVKKYQKSLLNRFVRYSAVAFIASTLPAQFVINSNVNAADLAPSSKQISEDQKYTHEYTLPNGLKLIVREDHRSPTVAHMVWYKAGSVDEHNGTTGVAHVLEHMMFKGTKSVAPGEFSKKVAALGGRENAFTSNDYTAYFQQIEKSKLNEVMKLESDRMENLKLSEEEFKKEIQVIMEERRLRTDDQAQSLLYEQFMATAFNASPNRHPVIGWMSDLRTMTYLDARHWYDSWYSPSNATVVVVGDVQPADVLKLVQDTYGRVHSKEIVHRKAQIEPEQKGIKRFTLKAPAENAVIYMGWKVPELTPSDLSQKDPYALEVLAGVLDGNPNTRLNRILVRAKRLALSVGAGYDSCCSRTSTLFMINASLMPGKNPTDVEAQIKKIIADIATNGISEAELQRVKIAITAAQVYKRDSVFGQAMEIGSAEMGGLSWKQMDVWHNNLQQVTAMEVQAVARKYFVDDHLTVGVLDPQPLDPKTQAANSRAASQLKH